MCVVVLCNVTRFMAKNLYDVFYNDGLFDNSKGKLTIAVETTTKVALNSNGNFTI
jgi:hypothetical protein